MNENEVLVQLATRIPRPLHRAVKIHCVKASLPLMEFVQTALQAELERATARPAKRGGKTAQAAALKEE